LPSKVSIKKPCQYFDRSCKTADTLAATIRGFGKAPADVNAIPSKSLSPIGKLVFYALAAKACGTNRTVWMSDGAIALRCGVSRPSVTAGLGQLLELGLVERVGSPVNQIQAYRICHRMFGSEGWRFWRLRVPRAASGCGSAEAVVREVPQAVQTAYESSLLPWLQRGR